MSTVGQLIDQIKYEFLTPPSQTTVQTPLVGNHTSSQTFINYTDLLMPEEEAKIGPGTVVEVEAEQMLVVSIDPAANQLTSVQRGYAGTSAVAHSGGVMLTVAPRHTRVAILRAIADATEALFPDLFAVNTSLLVDQGSGIGDLDDLNASHILSAHTLSANGEWVSTAASIIPNFPEVQVGPAVKVDNWGFDTYVTYARRFVRPTSETNDMQAVCLVEPQWEKIVKVGAVGALLGRSDVDTATGRYLTELLATQGVPVGSLTDLSLATLRYRLLLLEEAKRNLRRSYQPATTQRPLGTWQMGRL